MTQPTAPDTEQLLNLANRAEHGLTGPEADRLRDGVAHHCARAERAEAEIERMKLLVAASSESGHAVRMAAEATQRAERAEAERDAAQGDRDGWRDRAHGYRAATQRVRAIAQRMHDWDSNIPSTTRWVTELRAALDEQQEQPTGPAVHVGGNAEDCPACRPQIDKTVLYPWICPGPTDT